MTHGPNDIPNPQAANVLSVIDGRVTAGTVVPHASQRAAVRTIAQT
jgi:hypothetical protein